MIGNIYINRTKTNFCSERPYVPPAALGTITGKDNFLKPTTRWPLGNNGAIGAQLEGVDQLTTMLNLPHFPLHTIFT